MFLFVVLVDYFMFNFTQEWIRMQVEAKRLQKNEDQTLDQRQHPEKIYMQNERYKNTPTLQENNWWINWKISKITFRTNVNNMQLYGVQS